LRTEATRTMAPKRGLTKDGGKLKS
jgi:hypothetical protein